MIGVSRIEKALSLTLFSLRTIGVRRIEAHLPFLQQFTYLGVEAPLSPRDCSYKQVGLGWLHREQNQFGVQSLRLEVTHVVFLRGRHPRTPTKEKQ
jgi:hypothetical protein